MKDFLHWLLVSAVLVTAITNMKQYDLIYQLNERITALEQHK